MKKSAVLLCSCLMFNLFGTNAFVVNSNSQTLSKIDFETGEVNNVFSVIGLYANRVVLAEDFIYVVNSGDNSIQKIDLNNGETVSNIQVENFSNPYDMIIHNGFVYVTGLFTAKVYKIDLSTEGVVGEVSVDNSPEGMVVFDEKLYVANTNYVYPNYDQGTVSVIDLNTYEVITTIEVELNPQALVTVNDKIHVVCTGDYSSTFGKVCIIEPSSNSVEETLDIGGSPANITFSPNGNVYLGDGMGIGVYSYNAETYEIVHSPQKPFSSGGSSIATNSEMIAIVDAGNWVENSIVRLYDLNEEFISEYEVGIGAVNIAFSSENNIPENMNIKIYNFPNPFKCETTFSFNLRQTSLFVELNIYNIKGQRVKSFQNFPISQSANQQIVWNGKDDSEKQVTSGIYFYQLKMKDHLPVSGKMIITR